MNYSPISKSLKPGILIIDDDPLIHKFLQAALETMGYPILEAQNADQGLSLAIKHHPQLILLDIMLPDIDGLKLLYQIRHIEGLKVTPIIMLSGADTMKSIDQAFKDGANDYLKKPIDLDRLSIKIKKFLPPN